MACPRGYAPPHPVDGYMRASEDARWPARFARRRFSFAGFGRLERIGMCESLRDRLSVVFDRLRGRGALNEADVRGAMREVRIALLEADVALPVVRRFVDEVTEQAVGQQV